MLRKFTYPTEFKTLPDHRAHSGQIVEVGFLVNGDETSQDPDLERLFKIKASDGWSGEAFESELFPPVP